ncbi:unnamed protein product [Caenorhabditis brenneri]
MNTFSESKSIWNENPTVYIFIRQTVFTIFTLFYPFVFYVIFFKSPKSFGALKWFLLFHAFAITCQWLCSYILINFYTFVPSKITRIDGILVGIVDLEFMFITMYFVYFLATASCLLLFCNRIFSILNMYRGAKSVFRKIFEFVVYVGAFLFPSSVLYGFKVPDQSAVKAMTKQIAPYYPDCLDDFNVIVFISPDPEKLKSGLIYYLINLLTIALASIISAQLAYYLLSKRMSNQSEKTKKMHHKFNRRTLFQVLIDTSFTSIPFSVSNLATLFRWKVPILTYFVDLMSKNNPTACIIILFLYYDPYQNWLLKQVKLLLWRKNRTSGRSQTTWAIKSADT